MGRVRITRRGYTKNGALVNGMLKEVVLDGMKTAKGCVAQLQAHFHLKAEKG